MSAEKLAALELEHRLAAAEYKITELESQLKVAVEALEFYASENSWYLLETTASIITDEDLRDDKDSVKRIAGGKLASETLKKLTGVKPE